MKMFERIISKLEIIFIPCRDNNYRPKWLEGRFLIYCLVILVLLKLITVSFLVYLPKTIFFAEISHSLLIELTNKQREELGINLLEENQQLNAAAFLKAQDMLAQDYFSHQSPTGVTPWYWFQKADYDYQTAGENLGIGFLDSEEIYQAWDNSPSHRANLLNSAYQDIGIAVVKGDFEENETVIVVQLFGSPIETIAEPIVELIVESIVESKEDTVAAVQEIEPEQEQGLGDIQEEIKGETSAVFSFLKFMTEGYNNLVQKIIFYSLIFVAFALILNVFVRFDIQHKDLIIKAVFFGVALGLFILINKEIIIRVIPHSLGI